MSFDSLQNPNNPEKDEVSIFRSEKMSFIQIYIPVEISRFAVNELGELGIIQFKDLNQNVNAFQRTFAYDIRRFDEIERKIRYFTSEIEKEEIPIHQVIDENFANRSRGPQEIEEMEEEINDFEVRVRKFNQAFYDLKGRWVELVLHGLALYQASRIFERISKREAILHHRSTETRVRALSDHVDRDVLLQELSSPNRGQNGSFDDEEGVLLTVAHRNEPVFEDEFVNPPQRLNSIGSLEDLEYQRDLGTEGYTNGSRVLIDDINFGFVAGVVRRDRLVTMEKVLWRMLRGNIYMEYVDLEIDESDKFTGVDFDDMSLFIVFVHGELLQSRVSKISESFGATIYNISRNSEQRREDLVEILSQKNDIKTVLQFNKEASKNELSSVAVRLPTWSVVTKKEKSIFYVMNLFNYDESRRCLVSEGWCPTRDLSKVNFALRNATTQSGSNTSAVVYEISTSNEPPTYLRTNKFTKGFQNIIDSYGVPKYGEVNPGLFTTITFPFLFSIMFGDLGHGALMTLAALFLVFYEKRLSKIQSEEFVMLFSGRYMILLMGIFSMIVGLVYNDIFSRAMHFFPTGWSWPADRKLGQLVTALQTKGRVYLFGIDPTWHHSDNSLLFTNSYKMKMSILIGVVHMLFGMSLQIFNAKHFRKPINITHVFLPQVIFFLSIFGYLSLTIIYKWCINWYAVDSNGNLINNSPPSLLNMLIYMFLNPGSVEPQDSLYPGQAFIQSTLLLIAVVCIPWMLLAKPLILRAEHNKIVNEGYGQLSEFVPERLSLESVNSNIMARDSNESENLDGDNNQRNHSISSSFHIDNNDLGGHNTGNSNDKPFDFGDIMVNSTIHTIEFCLSGISHTASYLRLWALSLAHAQLSEVLWSMTIQNAFLLDDNLSYKPFAICFAFYVWFVLTISILLIMEGLSAFLHALRLHWVEFNSKFYDGSGEAFSPFSYKTME
ncbi:V-type proton ATPase subunit a [Smittium culicis]|uniref:V-type proton ATPase subunit a n=1 Tax=Smittium culicis TaxID=133412 RepID=A0A1R1YIE6_9FUNG|nr:V-type proton ATPase subunit a [Smittium culicis]